MNAAGIPAEISNWTLRLASGQAATSASIPLNATLGSVAAVHLTDRASLAGTSVGLAMLASVAALFVAGRISDQVGRRPVLLGGLTLLSIGAVLCGGAIWIESYALFVVGTLVFGAGQGPAMMHRAAAADLYPTAERAQGVGLVGSAGAVGSILGPVLVSGLVLAAPLLLLPDRSAPWLLVPLLCGAAILIERGIRIDPRDVARDLRRYFPLAPPDPPHGPPRPRRVLMGLAPARTAILTAALTQAAMVGVMGVTAVVLDDRGLGAAIIGLFVAAHFFGMFGLAAPLGRAADRVGRRPMLLAGLLVTMLGAIGTSLTGQSLLILPFFFLLGVGWSACWVAGTAVLADVTTPVERGRLMASNDQIVALAAAAAVLGAGPLLDNFGFPAVGIVLTTLCVIALVPILRLRETEPGRYGQAATAVAAEVRSSSSP